MHKDSKLGIVTNVGKSRLLKGIFSNIYKISDACVNSFDRYIMTAQCMRTFLLLINFKFLWKNGVSEKIKARLPQHPQALQQLFSPHFFHFIQKFFSLLPILKRDYAFDMRDSKERQQSYYHSIRQIFLFTVKSTFEEN